MSVGQVKYKLTPETIKKLEEAFAIDASITEACFYANIRTQTYYNWIEQFPEMKARFDELRNKPVLKARQTVVQKIGESYSNAMDYLKRKKKSEFGDSSELNVVMPKPLLFNLHKQDVPDNDSDQQISETEQED